METEKLVRNEDAVEIYESAGARPLRFVKDEAGEFWLCDKDVDVEGDLAAQGCWRCRDLAFTASD
jgi:hypothetical protein